LISKSSIRITRETSIISQKIKGFGGRPPVGGRPAPLLNPALIGWGTSRALPAADIVEVKNTKHSKKSVQAK